MDCKELVEHLKSPTWQDLEDPDSSLLPDAATAITDLLARAEAAEAENAALRKMQPVRIDDTGAYAASLAAEVSELRKKLAKAEQACAYYKHSMESYIERAKARYTVLEEARENANEAAAKWEGMYHMTLERAEKAEREIDKNSACWACAKNKYCHKESPIKEPDVKCGSFVWRGQKEE